MFIHTFAMYSNRFPTRRRVLFVNCSRVRCATDRVVFPERHKKSSSSTFLTCALDTDSTLYYSIYLSGFFYFFLSKVFYFFFHLFIFFFNVVHNTYKRMDAYVI